jgi:hypothetical protein
MAAAVCEFDSIRDTPAEALNKHLVSIISNESQVQESHRCAYFATESRKAQCSPQFLGCYTGPEKPISSGKPNDKGNAKHETDAFRS